MKKWTVAFGIGVGTILATMTVAQAANCTISTQTVGDLTVNWQGSGSTSCLGGTAEQSIYFNSASEATFATGSVGSNTTAQDMFFTAGNVVKFANGFATVDEKIGTGIFSLLVAAKPGYSFTDLLWHTQGIGSSNYDIQIKAFATDGTTPTVGAAPAPLITIPGSGLDDFIALSAANGVSFTGILITSTAGFHELKQFEVSGFSAVPLPPAALLFGTALVGMGILGRRRKNA